MDELRFNTAIAELIKLKAKTGDDITALFGAAMTPDGQPHPNGASRPTLIYFYGNGMCMADAIGIFLELRRQGRPGRRPVPVPVVKEEQHSGHPEQRREDVEHRDA